MDMLTPTEAPAAVPAFDYASLPKALAEKQRQRAERIAGIYRRTVEAGGEIGRELLVAQEELEHGTFLQWVVHGLGMSKSSAYRFMDMARSFGEKLPTVGNLPLTLVHKLSERATPEPVRAAVLRRIEAGETIQAREVLDEVREAKEAAKKQAAADREKARRAALTPEQRDEEDVLRSRSEKGRAAREQRQEQERDERQRHFQEERDTKKREATMAAQILLSGLGAETAASLSERFSRISHEVFQKLGDLAHEERAARVEPSKLHRCFFDRIGMASMGAAYWDDRQEVEALAEDIRQNELTEPVVVVRVPDPGKPERYRIVEGGRRFRALSVILNREMIPVRIAPPAEPLADG